MLCFPYSVNQIYVAQFFISAHDTCILLAKETIGFTVTYQELVPYHHPDEEAKQEQVEQEYICVSVLMLVNGNKCSCSFRGFPP